MAIQYINTGSSANAGNGDSLRSAFVKVNNNFAYLSTSSGSAGNGYTGSQGDIGYAGSQGNIGYTGSAGISNVNIEISPESEVNSLAFYQTTSTISRVPRIKADGGVLFIGDKNSPGFLSGLYIENSLSAEGFGRGFTYANHLEVAEANNFTFYRSRGTPLVPTATVSGDEIVDINFLGHNGTTATYGFNITASIDQVPVGGQQPMRLTFAGNNNAGQILPHLIITSTGTVRMNKLGAIGNSTSISILSSLIPSVDLTYDLGSTSSQWRSLYVGTSTVYFGGIPMRVTAEGGITVNDIPVSGSSTVQPYLNLTQSAFITQPVTLGTATTITAAMRGIDALVDVVIGQGPTIDSITVTTPGILYVVGQRYRINYWQVGGDNDADNIDFEVATIGSTGTVLTVSNAAFEGTATNTPGTYSGLSIEYRPTVFDEVDTGLTLTRGLYGGLFNSEEEFSYNSSVSPIGTLWNADGWGTLVGFNTRTYDTFDSILTGPDNTPPPELVMWDTINNKYYKFAINIWGIDNNEFSYTRTLITDPNYFRKTDGLQDGEIDVIVEDDGDGAGIGITRGDEQGIYNPYRENGWNSNTSPAGTVWNIDGWNDLTDIESRTYTNFYAAYGNGQLGNKVPGSKAIMYVSETDKYYAIDWISWTQGGNYGGFSYTRREIDLTKLDQGVRFADNTVQTTAYIPTNVVSTAPGLRRIETASGYNQVSVTQRVTNNYTGAINATTNGYELRIARTSELDAVLVPINEGTTNATFTLSFDNVTFREVWLSSVQATEYWFYYQNDLGQTTPQTENDPVYLRVTTGGDSVAWWSKNELPGGADNFRGAVIDYHAYTGDGTIIGTIHIVDDDGEEYITHTEVSSGSTDSMNNDLWIVTTEGTIRYGRFDGEASTLKIHWTAKVFYGDELYD
jgi:hypothetical protein